MIEWIEENKQLSNNNDNYLENFRFRSSFRGYYEALAVICMRKSKMIENLESRENEDND